MPSLRPIASAVLVLALAAAARAVTPPPPAVPLELAARILDSVGAPGPLAHPAAPGIPAVVDAAIREIARDAAARPFARPH